MAMPGRTHAVGGHKYKYGFNGKELDAEIAEGNYDFDERMYDSRIGRFFSTDPCEEDYSSFSPYCFAANNPILFVDVDGCGPGNPWLELLSVALDFVPGVGTVKNLVEAAVGYDLAGNKLEAWERIAMIVPGGALANKAFKAGKAVVKQVLKHADDIARISKKVFTKVVAKSKEIASKVDDIVDFVKRKTNGTSNTNYGKKYEKAVEKKLDKKHGAHKMEHQVEYETNEGLRGKMDHAHKSEHITIDSKTGAADYSKNQESLKRTGGKLKFANGRIRIVKPGELTKNRKFHPSLKNTFKNIKKSINAKVKKFKKKHNIGKIARLRSKF